MASMPLRRGLCASLEAESNRLIKESLVGVTKHSDKADILTQWKEQERYRREVYVASGTPDPSVRLGMFGRVLNPTRPELNCLGGETEVVVRDRGSVRIEDLADTTQEIFTSKGWSKGEFRSYGVGDLQRIVLTRAGVEKVVWATPNHRWLVNGKGQGVYKSGARKGRPYAQLHCPSVVLEVPTSGLVAGQRMATKYLPMLIGQTTPSAFGVAHGFSFGDGSRVSSKRGIEGGSSTDLFGEKEFCLLPYFPNPALAYYPRPDVSVSTVRVTGLPGYFKDLPSISESVPYLYGWLAGYVAADGDVTVNGYCRLSSHSLSNLLFARDVCYRLGITVSSPTVSHGQNPFTGEPYTMYTLQIDKWSLTEPFFILDSHRARWVNSRLRTTAATKDRWLVQSVDPVSESREVYCAVVPTTEDFLLTDYLLTGNSRSGVSRPRTMMGTMGLLAHMDSDVD